MKTNKEIEEIVKKEKGFIRDILDKFEGKELEDEILFLLLNALHQIRQETLEGVREKLKPLLLRDSMDDRSWNSGYNAAISDIINLIQAKKI